MSEIEKLKAINADLLAALIEIAERLEDHPSYILAATEEDMEREGGDAAEITYLAQQARAAIAKATGDQP